MEETVQVKDVPATGEKKKRSHYQTKQQLAYEIIRSKILDGAYKPLQHLRMVDLTKEIGVSSIPIREALKQLENEGLIKFHPNRGAEVVSYSPEEFENLYVLRATLEGLAGRLGTKNLTEAGIDRMKELLEKMGLVTEKGDLKEKNQLNFEFHQILYQAANFFQLYKMITNLWDNTYQSVYTVLAPKFIPGYLESDQKHHSAVLEAVTARLPEQVEQLLKDEISRTGKIMVEYLRNSVIFRMES
jgi:DNA-binding GntR family transcriptional regulator